MVLLKRRELEVVGIGIRLGRGDIAETAKIWAGLD